MTNKTKTVVTINKIAGSLWLLLIALCHNFANASPFINPGPIVKQIEHISGSTLESVVGILQDDTGFMWLATKNGLVRYDGYAIKKYLHQPENPHSLAHNNVKALIQDKAGFIWLTHTKGLSRFDPNTEHFTHFSFDKNDPSSLSTNRINAISYSGNKLWLATRQGINLIDVKTLNIQRLNDSLQPTQNSGTQNILRIFEDNQQRLWYSIRGEGVSLIDLNSSNTTHFKFDPSKTDSLNANMVHAITQTPDGTVWIGTEKGINRFDSTTQTFKRYPIMIKKTNVSDHLVINSLFEDAQQRLWIGTFYNGVSVLHPNAATVTHISDISNSKNGLNSLYIHAITQDNSGALWFGTSKSGLIKLTPDALIFNNYAVDAKKPLEIKVVYTDTSGVLWIGTNKDLYRYDHSTGQFELMAADVGYIVAITQDSNNTLILVVSFRGLLAFDRHSQKLRAYRTKQPNNPLKSVSNFHSVAIDQQDTLWVGLFNAEAADSGLFRIDKQGSYTQFLANNTIEAILPMAQKILVGTRRNGLHLYDKTQDKWALISDEKHDTSRIWSLYQDQKQRIWLGTNDSGLAQLNLDTLQMTFVTTTDGLPTNTIRSIVEDQQGNLWLGTTNGIVRYNPQSARIKVYDKTHGSRITSIFPRMSAVLPNGDITMSNLNEMVIFSPKSLENATQQQQNYPILLSDFRLFNQPVTALDGLSPLAHTINQTQQLTLSHRQYWFSFAIASSNYKHLDTLRYAYKMEGLKDQWIETDGTNRIISFTSLPAKDYVLKIKASNPDGSWNDAHRRLNITITPPWWLTWQAYLLYAIALLGSGYTFYHIRTRGLIKRADVLEKTVVERTATINTLLSQKERMFANISHEFKTPLTLILSPLESITPQTPIADVGQKVSMMKRNGQRLLRMVEQLLELSRLDTLDTGVRHRYSIKASLELLLTSFQPLLDSKNLNLRADNLCDAVVSLKADALEMILTNLISNAIKYTSENGTITIDVKTDESTTTLSITDTGIGISPDNLELVFNRFTRANEDHDESIPGAGIGLALVKELVENDQGTITLTSQIGQGSTFTVTFPTSHQDNQSAESIVSLSSTSQNEIDTLLQSKSESPVDDPLQSDTTGKPTLLLIDDNADMLTLLKDTRQNRYHCISAKNGELGLEQAQQQIPDLIICDVMMPGISGYEVAKRLKQNELTCHIPVVLLTAKGDMDSRMEGWKQDIDDYLPKPFHPKELHLRIQSLLSIRHILKKRFNQQVATMQVSDKSTTNQDESSETPIKAVLSDKDVQFIERFKAVIEEQFHEPAFSREQAAALMLISDRQLHRKLNALLEDTFTEYLRSFRLDRSVELLTTGLQIGQISDQVGFTSMAYFSKCFKAQFNKTPKQYQKELTV